MAQARETRRARRPRREREREETPRSDEQRDERDEDDTRSEPTGGAFAQLKDVMSESAVGVLSPVAKKLAKEAAKMAVDRGPELIEDTILPKLQDAGSLFGGDGKKKRGKGDGTGKGRRMPIQQAVDVAAPLEVVYDQFTQFEDFPKFMHRVERVEQRDDDRVVFHEKIWGVRRMWEAEIVEQRPDERIAWKTVGGVAHVGAVTFHELSDRLTRIELNIDIDPEGVMEKIARGARFAKRATRADLKRFKAFVEMREEETGAWRGAIEDGEVVDEDEYYEDEEEPEAYEDEDEDEEDSEEENRRATARQKSNGGRSKSQSKSKSKSKASGNGRRSGSRAKATSGKRSK